VSDIEVPEPTDGEVRVRVHAASVNGFDVAVANSYLKDMMEHRFPVVIGKDFSGIVDALGPGVSDYQVGDRVFGVVTKPHLGDGSIAEYVTVATSVGMAPLPEQIDLLEGATLGLAGSAAIAAVDAAQLAAGQMVLVAGATGGVGNQAVQLAVRAGASVIATAHSDEERRLVTELGAAETVDYQADVVAALRESHPAGVDVVLHFAGDPATLVGLVRPGGRFVSTMLGSPEQVPSKDVTVVPVYANPDPATLARCAANRLEDLRVTIERTYPIDEAATALTDFAAGTLGKLVVAIG
jgi:NADPH:quinone reductase-like Zn-dependent oxidoreductase